MVSPTSQQSYPRPVYAWPALTFGGPDRAIGDVRVYVCVCSRHTHADDIAVVSRRRKQLSQYVAPQRPSTQRRAVKDRTERC